MKALYQGEFVFPWPLTSAALIVALVPIAVLIIGGLTGWRHEG